MAADTTNDNLDNFVLPSSVAHHSRVDKPHETDEYGLNRSTPANRWMEWILKLKFMKGGVEKNGNAFLVNVPNKKYDVILTAGHNLVDKANTYTTDLRIVRANGVTPVTRDMVRVCQTYLENPSENFAIYDYGVILLPRGKKALRGFGFGLALSIAPSLSATNAYGTSCDPDQDPLQNHLVYVSGYRPKDSPDSKTASETQPRRSEGTCLKATASQLVYRADTEAGMSGGPVWMGFRGSETVVAIHNYGGGDEKNPKNKGSRINLEVWRNVCTWAEAMWTNKSLHYEPNSTTPNKAAASSSLYKMHLHIQMPNPMPDIDSTYIDEVGSGRVHVGCPGRVETLFDILPVVAQPTDDDSLACFGFLLTKYAIPEECNDEEEAEDDGTGVPAVQPPPAAPAKVPVKLGKKKSLWVHWNPTSNLVSVAEFLDTHAEVRLINLVMLPQKQFMIRVRVDGGWKQVMMGHQNLMEADLEPLADDPEAFEDTTEVSFVGVSNDKYFKFQ